MGQNLYTISINLDKEKHKELIAWIKKISIQEDSSLSRLCLVALKEYKKIRDKQESQETKKDKSLRNFPT